MNNNIFTVPAKLKADYDNEPVPTELDILKSLQGDGTHQMAAAMAFADGNTLLTADVRKKYAERIDFHDYVAHRIRLDRAQNKRYEREQTRQRAINQEQYDDAHRCPVCKEVADPNTFERTCKLCQLMIDYKLANTKQRARAVDAYMQA